MSERLSLHMSRDDIIKAMARTEDGNHYNPGALRVMLELLSLGSVGMFAILKLDSMGIYASELWEVYSDYCGGDCDYLKTLLMQNPDEIKLYLGLPIEEKARLMRKAEPCPACKGTGYTAYGINGEYHESLCDTCGGKGSRHNAQD